MNIQDKIDALLERGITRTRFSSIVIQSNEKQGQPIGQGKCKAVILKANHHKTYALDDPQLIFFAGKFYYGDQHQQTNEYLVNTNSTATDTNTRDSELIFCKDLKDVWVFFNGKFIETDAVSRIVTGTADGGGAEGDIVILGGLEGTAGIDFDTGADEFELVANIVEWANFHLSDIPAISVVDNMDGSFTVTCELGAAANDLRFDYTPTGDTDITFETTQEGADTVFADTELEIQITIYD